MRAVSRRQLTRCCVAILIVTLVAALAGPMASALVYWTTFGGNLGRANLDGSVADTGWISSNGAPTGIAVDSSYVYWTRYNGDAVARANIDGTSPGDSWITGAAGPNGLAVNGTYVYWANTDTNEIGRANLDGSSPNQSWITAGSDPTGIAIDGSYIYWTNYNSGTDTIGRANLDGTSPDDSFITGASNPSGIAVDGSYIYWTNYGAGGTIGRANLDGSGVNQNFITGIVSSIALTVDANYIYWTTTDDIGRANIDGSGADAAWIADVGSNTRGVAVNATATPVTLVAFTARAVREDIKVHWETAAEIDTAGFHVWRRAATDEEFERVTGKLIPGEGNPFSGAAYSWLDTAVEPGTAYWYKLEDIDYAGVSSFHGPVRAVRKKK
jgi:hypothetical protein